MGALVIGAAVFIAAGVIAAAVRDHRASRDADEETNELFDP